MRASKLKIAGVALALGLMSSNAYSDNLLQNYLDVSASIIPNAFELSLFEEVKYNDNIHNSPSRDSEGAMIFKTGGGATIFRTKGNVTYGLQGELSYDWYTKDSNDMNAYDWSISPYIEGNFGKDFLQGLMISLKSRSVYEPYSKSDTRYVRHFENGLGLAYDYSRHERWGAITTFQYMNKYYPQGSKNYSSATNNSYDFSIAPYYKLTQKVRTGLQLAYEIVDYRNEKKYDDSTNVSITGFVDYRVNMFLSMTAHAGMERDAFNGKSRGSNNDRDFEPKLSYIVRYIPGADWTISYILRYEPEYGSDSGRGQRQAWNNSLAVSWNASSKINITQSVGFDWQDEKNSKDDTNELTYSLRVNYYATDHITFYGGYEYDGVHFKYNGDGDYHSNEFILGLRWSL